MGLFDAFKAKSTATKAYRTHVAASQLRKKQDYAASEAKFAEARKLYEQAAQEGCQAANYLMSHALLLMRYGEFERSRDMLLECFKSKDLSADDRFNVRVDYAICQWKLGRLDKAIESVERAATVKMNGTIYTTLGMFLVEQAKQTGDFERLQAFNDEALNYDDEDAPTLDNVGQMYLAMSDKALREADKDKAAEYRTKAFEAEKKAYSLKKEQVTSAYFYAMLLGERGENAKALEVLDSVTSIPVTAVSQISNADLDALRSRLAV